MGVGAQPRRTGPPLVNAMRLFPLTIVLVVSAAQTVSAASFTPMGCLGLSRIDCEGREVVRTQIRHTVTASELAFARASGSDTSPTYGPTVPAHIRRQIDRWKATRPVNMEEEPSPEPAKTE